MVISTDCTGSKFNYNTITASLIFIEDKQLTINRCIFSLILQLNVFINFYSGYLPLMWVKRSPFIQSLMKTTDCFPIIRATFWWCHKLWIFYLLYNYSLILIRFKYLQIVRKLYSKFFVLSVALGNTGTILATIREITPLHHF